MPKNDEPIRGKIASIVTKKSVIINRGTQDGVEEGMLFAVQLEIGRVEDPDDPANIMEGLSFPKARIEVTTVYDRMSYCEIKATGYEGGGEALSKMFGGKAKYPAVNSLLIADHDWSLSRGDPVSEVVPDDEIDEIDKD